MISIQDNGRLLYKNAMLRAWAFSDPTTAIHFFNADGTDLGLNLRTNALGYVIYGENQLRANGYFVAVKAIIEVSIDNGVNWSIQWTVDTGTNTANAGRYMTRAGIEVWNANSAADFTPDYNHLLNTPELSTWRETEYLVEVEHWGQVIEVPDFVTVLRFKDKASCLNASCSYRKAVQLVFGRYAQQVIAINETASDITLWNIAVPSASQVLWDNPEQYTNAACNLTPDARVAALGVTRLSDGTYTFWATNGTSFQHKQTDVEYTIVVATWGQAFTIPKDVSVLKIYTDVACNGANNNCDYRTAVQLIFTRPGQQCHVISMSHSDMQLWVAPNMSQPADANGWANATCVLPRFGMCTSLGVGTIDGTNVIRWWAINPNDSATQNVNISVANETEQLVQLDVLTSDRVYDIQLANTTRVLTLVGNSSALPDDTRAIKLRLYGGQTGQTVVIGRFVDLASIELRHSFIQHFVATFANWSNPETIITNLPSACGQTMTVRICRYPDTTTTLDYAVI